ncbi:hypothetical protein BDR26DRAFT_856277 [Obelidium mucronatum]|nr:hypothetical protein BDR26DRAFT_856277 [Obelidium mucronatum]
MARNNVPRYEDPDEPNSWQKVIRPIVIVLLALSGIAGIMLVSIQMYEQAFIAGAINLVLLLAAGAVGGLGVWWRRKLLLYIYTGVAVLWMVFCLLNMIVLLNLVSIGGLSSMGFLGRDAISYYNPTPLPTKATATTNVTTSATVRTTSVNSTTTTGVSITTTSIVATVAAVPTSDLPTTIENGKKRRQDPVNTVTSSTTSAAGNVTTSITSRSVTSNTTSIASTQTNATTTAISNPPSSGSQPTVVFLEAIAYGIQILLLLFSAILAPFVKDDDLASKPDGFDSRGTVYVEKNKRGSDDEGGDEDDESRYNGRSETSRYDSSRYDESSVNRYKDTVPAVATADRYNNGKDKYNNGAEVIGGGRYRPDADVPVPIARPVRGAGSVSPASGLSSPVPSRRNEGVVRNPTVTKVSEPEGRIGPSSVSPSRPPRGASSSNSVERTPTGSKKYVAGPHNVEAVPTLSRRDVYSVYTAGGGSSANSRDTSQKESSAITSSSGAATVKPAAGQAGVSRSPSGKEPKVRCKYCDEKMLMSETASHVCASPNAATSTPAVAPTASAAPPGRKPRADSERKEEKLDGKKVKVVKRFAPSMGDELALEVGDVVFVKESFGDGWASGKNETSDEIGVFPLSCVSKTAKSAQNRVQSVYGFKR